MVFLSPVGSYFKGGVKPLNLKVETDYHRAAPRGIGNAKAIGNYSASLYPLMRAKKEGFDEVIYLDSKNEDRIEELGSANLFIVTDGVIRTPKLSGSILDGVTRNSVCRIASELLKYRVEETNISIKDLIEANEVFCTGTAVVVTPIGKITYNDTTYEINQNQLGPVASECKELLTAIQRQEINDPFGWIEPVVNSN